MRIGGRLLYQTEWMCANLTVLLVDRFGISVSLAALFFAAFTCGGMFGPLVMGWFRDLGWNEFSYIVPALCFAYLLLLSMKDGRRPADASRERDAAGAT